MKKIDQEEEFSCELWVISGVMSVREHSSWGCYDWFLSIAESSINIQAKLHEHWLHIVSSLWISIMSHLYPHNK